MRSYTLTLRKAEAGLISVEPLEHSAAQCAACTDPSCAAARMTKSIEEAL